MERELFARLPWTYALEVSERKELLRLLRKMLEAGREQQAKEALACPRAARAPRTPSRTGAARAAAGQDEMTLVPPVISEGKVTSTANPALPGGN